MSHQVPIIFHDVAASFTEDQWLRLESWQRDLYKNVMREIHEALTTLGYAIANPDVLFNIKKPDESCVRIDCSSGERKEIFVGDHPDILIRIEADDSDDNDECFVEPLNSRPVITSIVSLNMKEDQDLQDVTCPDSPGTMMSSTDSQAPYVIKTEKGIFSIEDNDMEEMRDRLSFKLANITDHSIKHEEDEFICEDNIQIKDPMDCHSPASISVTVKEEEDDDEDLFEEDELTDGYSTVELQDANIQQNEFLETQFKNTLLERPEIKEEEGKPAVQDNMKIDNITRCHGIKCVIVKKETDNENLKEIEPTPDPVVDASATCSRAIHQEGQAYKCVECDEWFLGMTSLTLHQATHTSERPYSCDECPKTYRYQSSLYKHKKTHRGKGPFACEDCDKTFTLSVHLLRHQLFHTKKKPYECKRCDKKFRHQSGFDKHNLVKHVK